MITYWAYCCQWWECAMGYPLGRCGKCGERPKVAEWDQLEARDALARQLQASGPDEFPAGYYQHLADIQVFGKRGR